MLPLLRAVLNHAEVIRVYNGCFSVTSTKEIKKQCLLAICSSRIIHFSRKKWNWRMTKSSNKATKIVSELCFHYATSVAYFRRVRKQLRGDI